MSAAAPHPDGERVVAVIVTRHRPESLAQALEALAVQTRPVDSVVVVDNGPDQPAEEVVRSCGLPHTYLLSQANLGGAGGFALGMLTALADGADWVWCADDDGRPADEHVLATLLSVARARGLAEVSPAVADIDAPGSFAFPVRTGLRWKGDRAGLGGEDFLPGYASLFNGALFAAATLAQTGVPDLRLFARGDETEIHRRLVRAGLPFGTALHATYLHPNGRDEFKPILGGRLSAQYPESEWKRFYTYRNRGYLMRQPGMRWLFPLELVRFGWFFLVTRRDLPGFRDWLRLVRAGRAERFTPAG
ncbi:rhamnopyranosyl-N-acetylglucosaminyl-diphospho-decaprenol beta-1,3/1,4-galactofuranosyltransferase [Geodermatophilus pulveris]|uniref:Rhamnopyranosyl-N-acetylglucosaminyl-diphospho-decaprenol beta-1,3/1,4-galactofuranosyltransferase n=1 Tax=Geodermatophilus pulveris TaxID=1564159 RepID=A0A239B107_9ACTN|nr:glycosyltransferase family 2 protein [Geodermatophilus pulveris]SNS01490.1 rhamnopyranosyl-N-acetylglucosaminyl-diphospho-decaprenol beta-1,3/1,4-galactofuranosyltransferase [Geodermatophilus pulveris]